MLDVAVSPTRDRGAVAGRTRATAGDSPATTPSEAQGEQDAGGVHRGRDARWALSRRSAAHAGRRRSAPPPTTMMTTGHSRSQSTSMNWSTRNHTPRQDQDRRRPRSRRCRHGADSTTGRGSQSASMSRPGVASLRSTSGAPGAPAANPGRRWRGRRAPVGAGAAARPTREVGHRAASSHRPRLPALPGTAGRGRRHPAGRRQRHDDHHHDVDEHEDAAREDGEQHPGDPDQRRVDVEPDRQAARDARDRTVGRVSGRAVQSQPSSGLRVMLPRLALTSSVDAGRRSVVAGRRPRVARAAQAPVVEVGRAQRLVAGLDAERDAVGDADRRRTRRSPRCCPEGCRPVSGAARSSTRR